MNTMRRRLMGLALSATALASIGFAHTAYADSREQLNADGERALHKLRRKNRRRARSPGRPRRSWCFVRPERPALCSAANGERRIARERACGGLLQPHRGSWGLQLGVRTSATRCSS